MYHAGLMYYKFLFIFDLYNVIRIDIQNK